MHKDLYCGIIFNSGKTGKQYIVYFKLKHLTPYNDVLFQ